VPLPTLTITPTPPSDSSIVYGVYHINKELHLLSQSAQGHLPSLLAMKFDGATDSFVSFPSSEDPEKIISFVGLGNALPSEIDIRNGAAVATRNLSAHAHITLDFGDRSESELLALMEGSLIGSYNFTSYKTSKSESVTTHISVIGSIPHPKKLISEAETVAQALTLVKDLVNTPPNDLYPESFVSHAVSALQDLPVRVEIWDEKDLDRDGFGGILGVGKGSSRPPRLMKIDYAPKKTTRHISLVGKGITFDTGGLSLKTGAGMIGMKYDMTGAATALAVIKAVAEMSLPIHMTAWLCLAENMPSSTATRPNDVLRIYGGKTVEVLNTDAEGRLVLADGLVIASEDKPDLLIDIATLTGAATTALGTRFTGAMGDESAISHLTELGRQSGELFWHMPLPDEIRGYLKSDVADIANVKPGNTAGGMLVGATFLKEFVGKTSDKEDAPSIPWIHLDIANTANNSGSPFGATGVGPTGVSVRTLIKLAQSYS
jgi:leucyl aminopeptidase